ncbi:MAG: hypothetical protein ACRC3I_01930 [Cetobacterium sp.]
MIRENILESIEIAFKNKVNESRYSEIDETVLKQKLDNGDIPGALKEIKYFDKNCCCVVDVTDLMIDTVHENLREIEFPNDLNGFDYEVEYGTKALMEYLEQKEKNDLELEIFKNLKECPNHSYADVDFFILENRVEKYKVDIIQKIKMELEK